MVCSVWHILHREPILITELCDIDVTEITELPAEEAIPNTDIWDDFFRFFFQKSVGCFLTVKFTSRNFLPSRIVVVIK